MQQALDFTRPASNHSGRTHAKPNRNELAGALHLVPRSGTQRQRVLDAFCHLGEATDQEVAAYLGLPLASVNGRRSELVAGGHICDSGRDRTTEYGTKRTLWRVTK